MFSSPLKKGSKLTSRFGKRWGTEHWGADYAPLKKGVPGDPVYAVHSGFVEKIGRGNGAAGAPIPYKSGVFVYLNIGYHGGDVMRVYYGHLIETAVKEGQKVRTGEIIGYMGGTAGHGQQEFPVHLHLGVSQNSSTPLRAARFFRDPGWIDPAAWLKTKGVIVGVSQPIKSEKTIIRTTINRVPVYSHRSKILRKQIGVMYKKGYRVQRLKTSGSWTQIRFKKQNAWVATQLMEEN